MITFENHIIRFIAPIDLSEGKRHVEPVREEFIGGWHHAYNIYEEYIHPTTDEEFGWKSSISVLSDSDDVLKN